MTGERKQDLRLKRLRQIAEEHTEDIYDAEARDQLAGIEPVAPLAAVTSEGSAESSFHSNGNLLVFGTKGDMEKVLARELLDGWVAHGRVWDLDREWDPWGNLTMSCTVQIGEVESDG
jgi:hypothetical protein